MRIHVDLFNAIWHKVVNMQNKRVVNKITQYHFNSVVVYYSGDDRYITTDNLCVYCTHDGKLQLHFEKGDFSELSNLFNMLIT